MPIAPARPPQGRNLRGCMGVALSVGLSTLDLQLPSLHGAAPHEGIGRTVGAFADVPEQAGPSSTGILAAPE